MNLTDIFSQVLRGSQSVIRPSGANARYGDAGNYLASPSATVGTPPLLADNSQNSGGLLGLLQQGIGGQQQGAVMPAAPSPMAGLGEKLAELGPIIAMMDPMGRNNTMAAAMMQMQQGKKKDARDAANQNQTVAWLQSQGMGEQEAHYLAADRDALRSWYGEWKAGNKPDWAISEIYDQAGRPQKVMYDKRDPSRYNVLGGSQSDTLSPEAEAQKVRIAQAGRAETNVSIGAEKGFDKTVGEGYGKRFLDLQEQGSTAQRALNSLDVMGSSLSDPGFYSGAGGDSVLQLKRFGASLGMNPDGITSMEQFNAMSKQAALDSMGGSLGSGFSNADRDFVIDQVPNLGNTPEGNRKLVDIQRKLNERKRDIAGIARDYASRNDGRIDAGFDDYLAKWSEQNPLFRNTPRDSTGRGAGNETGRQRARNPKTGETVEWDGTQWRPVR